MQRERKRVMISRYKEIDTEMYLAYESLLIRVSVLYTILQQNLINTRHPKIIIEHTMIIVDMNFSNGNKNCKKRITMLLDIKITIKITKGT
jgi:dipeptide/tripeptide permease